MTLESVNANNMPTACIDMFMLQLFLLLNDTTLSRSINRYSVHSNAILRLSRQTIISTGNQYLVFVKIDVSYCSTS